MAKRADAAPINRIPVAMDHKVKGLAALPRENNCQGSAEKAQPVGLAIDKNQPAQPRSNGRRVQASSSQARRLGDPQR